MVGQHRGTWQETRIDWFEDLVATASSTPRPSRLLVLPESIYQTSTGRNGRQQSRWVTTDALVMGQLHVTDILQVASNRRHHPRQHPRTLNPLVRGQVHLRRHNRLLLLLLLGLAKQ